MSFQFVREFDFSAIRMKPTIENDAKNKIHFIYKVGKEKNKSG